MWIDIGSKLGFKTKASMIGKSSWVVVTDTWDFKMVRRVIIDAKNNSMFIAISDFAGIGKSAPLKTIAKELEEESVHYLCCWDWGKKEFLINVCKTLGIDTGRGVKTPNELLQSINEHFQHRASRKPVLIIDQFDKLKASAKGYLIPLFNENEDMLGCIIAGTEHLEKEIKTGVRYQSKGFDEIDSRFGRKYLKIRGCNLEEATKICIANGVSNQSIINDFFEQCNPIRKLIKVDGKEQSLRVITDMRRLKRLILREQLKSFSNN